MSVKHIVRNKIPIKKKVKKNTEQKIEKVIENKSIVNKIIKEEEIKIDNNTIFKKPSKKEKNWKKVMKWFK